MPIIMKLRKHLIKDAVYAAGRVDEFVKKPKLRRGYSNNIVNMTMWAFRALLDIAVSKRVIGTNPFLLKLPLEGRMNLPVVRRKPTFPSCAAMQNLFAEMRRIPSVKPLRWDGRKTRRESEPMRARR